MDPWSTLKMKLLQLHYLLALFLPIVSTYTIEDCGNDKPAIGYAITLAQTTVIRPLLDLQLGISSIHGYTAMYKSNIFKAFLQTLMSKILHLPVTQAAGRDQEPTFVCAKANMEQKYAIGYDPLDRCARTGVTSFWAKDTAIVFLCPSFTTLGFNPSFTPHGPVDIYCPLVQNNVFLGHPDPLVRYQSYDLVHQLVHLYLQDGALTSQTEPKEVMDWNSCVGLGWTPFEGGPTVKNPFNLVYYVACKCRLEGIRICRSADWRQSSIRNAHRCRTRLRRRFQDRMIKRVCSLPGMYPEL